MSSETKPASAAATDCLEVLKKCPLCDSGALSMTPVQPQPPFGLTQCNDCGLIFLSPRPPVDQMKAFYDSIYDDESKDVKSQRQMTRAQRHIRRLSRYISPPGRVLEVGAGDGYFLNAAREAGWQVDGMDLAQPRVERAKKWFNISLHNCDLLSAPFEPGTFNVMSMFQLIEHVHDPRAIFMKAHQLLKPGGILMLSTPNVLAYSRKKRDVNSWVIPRHLFFFSPKTLVRCAEICGFKVVRRPLKFIAAVEERLNWTPWPSGPVSRLTRDLWTPFGLNLIAKKL
jgi:SAM-dependent methyltransferase